MGVFLALAVIPFVALNAVQYRAGLFGLRLVLTEVTVRMQVIGFAYERLVAFRQVLGDGIVVSVVTHCCVFLVACLKKGGGRGSTLSVRQPIIVLLSIALPFLRKRLYPRRDSNPHLQRDGCLQIFVTNRIKICHRLAFIPIIPQG